MQTEDALAERICQRGVQPESNTNLWACLGRLISYKDGGPLPRDTLAANVGVFFAAGYETTAHAITWALFELAADQSIQVTTLFLAVASHRGHVYCMAFELCVI